jgi:hypothetical protein
MSSAVMGFLALFSVNMTIIATCAVTAVVCLVASGITLFNNRVPMAFAFAAAPGLLLVVPFTIGPILGL